MQILCKFHQLNLSVAWMREAFLFVGKCHTEVDGVKFALYLFLAIFSFRQRSNSLQLTCTYIFPSTPSTFITYGRLPLSFIFHYSKCTHCDLLCCPFHFSLKSNGKQNFVILRRSWSFWLCWHQSAGNITPKLCTYWIAAWWFLQVNFTGEFLHLMFVSLLPSSCLWNCSIIWVETDWGKWLNWKWRKNHFGIF